MIWYFLYPLRGTTDEPILAPTHPVCACFAKYGHQVSRHVVATLLISGVVATILIYPIPFLFTSDFTNGASNLPHHVWTIAQPLPKDAMVEPDVIMRSIWIHADYMQDELLGPTEDFSPVHRYVADDEELQPPRLTPARRDALHIANGLTSQSWFFYSPLLYWACSKQRILEDPDILGTVNERKNQSTAASITLRHSIVFSGKRFEDRRLLAADALVITLIHLRDSPIGHRWETISPSLPDRTKELWDIYPSSGQVSESQLYEFQFRPMSFQDVVTLTMAYGLTLVYFLTSLSKVRAIKSKAGLTVTVVVQVTLAIMSSFTICAAFDVDLSRIPRAVYPLVILALSLKNIFRLTNAVILTPSEDKSSNRLGYAYGQTAHVALASTVQNIGILLLLSRMVSPSVANFCVFATVAIVFDFFYLSTFFMSVLSLDVRRMELGDALAKSSKRKGYSTIQGDQISWIEHVLRGKVGLLTRIAGTIVMIGFVLIVQLHFGGEWSVLTLSARLLRLTGWLSSSVEHNSHLLENLHQARSPTSWLRLQDHETAREIIGLLKPNAYSYTARVFDPLVFVWRNSDRMLQHQESKLLPAVYDFVRHQSAQFVTVIFVVAAGLRLLTSYVLWDDEEGLRDPRDLDENSSLVIRTLSGGHCLDVVMLVISSQGHIISVGLDRTIRVYDARGSATKYLLRGDGDDEAFDLFPVVALATDNESTTLAILSTAKVRLWSLSERCWLRSVSIRRGNERPKAFVLTSSSEKHTTNIFLLEREGDVIEVTISPEGDSYQKTRVFPEQAPIAQSLIYLDKPIAAQKIQILALSKEGVCCKACLVDTRWESRSLMVELANKSTVQDIRSVTPFALFLALSQDTTYMLPNAATTRDKFYGLCIFTICYIEKTSQRCVLRTFVPASDSEALKSDDELETNGRNMCSWTEAKTFMRHVENPGVWELVSGGVAIGVRQRPRYAIFARYDRSGMRQRFPKSQNLTDDRAGRWEAWSVSAGEIGFDGDEIRRLILDENKESDHLFTSRVGPRATVGSASVAFCIGEAIKIVTIGGQERYSDNQVAGEACLSSSNRRRRHEGLARTTRGPLYTHDFPNACSTELRNHLMMMDAQE